MSNTCALCGKKNVQLMASHLIPKLVYKQNKTYPNSRFRIFSDLNTIYQDGEKKHLLCSECEQHFSKFEVVFARKFHNFLETGNKKDLMYENINQYVLSVAWRILYDDIILRNSFHDKPERSYWEDYNCHLKVYLESLKTSSPIALNKNIKTYIYTLSELGYDKDVAIVLEKIMFGYCKRTSDYSKLIVIVYYNELIFVTVYNTIVIGRKLISLLLDKFTNIIIKKEIKEEIEYQVLQIANDHAKREAFMDSATGTKIKKRYQNSKKI